MMGRKPRQASLHRSPLAAAALALLASASLGSDCGSASLGGSVPRGLSPGSGNALFTSPQTNPLALSPRGDVLYVANTTAGTLSVLAIDPADPSQLTELAEIPVGLDPVSVAVRPPLRGRTNRGDELVLVANHVSDSISVVSRNRLEVIQTLQGLDSDGVTTTNEPVGVTFASRSRAFVTLDEPDQVLAIRFRRGRAEILPKRLQLSAQAPRALAVAGGKLFVAAFESGNQTEFPSCAPDDTRGLDEGDAFDEGCEFPMRIFDGVISQGGIELDTIFEFATGPNIGGRVIRDRDLPDRDLFVYDAKSLRLEQVVEGVGTLLYGLATDGSRVWVSNTDARNHLDGLAALENRMFDNRVSFLDCASGSCGAPVHVDLDAGAASLGGVIPTPYGIAASGDGATVVVTGAGSDGVAPGEPGTPPGQPELFSLATLTADGQVQGAVRLGAIPQGVALASDGDGAARTAYVLNTVDATLSVVDVSDPTAPQVLAPAIPVGSDPTPAEVRRGRIAFSTARASTSGNFSCESCHPNANMDQLLWVINTVHGPNDVPDPGDAEAEPRLTMPVRGLRDTLPLHWDGTLGDPVGGVNGAIGTTVTAPANCDGESPGTCFRHLANASLSGVMCAQDPDCAVGVATDGMGTPLPGALTDAERNDLAAFLSSVSYPPSPRRRPTDALSPVGVKGASDFFTNADGKGIGGPGGLGQFVGFAPLTCADNAGGCHSLPLTASTNSTTVGGFEAPTMRGMWDRFVLFSNGLMSSEESLVLAQRCADADPPQTGTSVLNDPCNPQPIGFGLNEVYPTGADIWDPARGMTPLSSHLASFELIFSIAYGVRGEDMWEFFNEMSVGFPGLLGRQVELSKRSVKKAETAAAVTQLEAAAREGRIAARASGAGLGELRFDPLQDRWVSQSNPAESYDFAALRQFVRKGKATLTLRADLPPAVSPDTPQPLLNVDPASIAVEQTGDGPALPRPEPGSPGDFTLGYAHVQPGAAVLLDGAVCGACAIALAPGGGFEGADVLTLSLPGLAAGLHMVQVQNPAGLASNELPVVAEAPAP
jgi:DNA-binding beta-propeller fold protein YncE